MTDEKPRKAYLLQVNAKSWKDVIVWGDTAEDALERFLDHDEDNYEVVDTNFQETSITRARRHPEEDRG